MNKSTNKRGHFEEFNLMEYGLHMQALMLESKQEARAELKYIKKKLEGLDKELKELQDKL